MQSRTTRRVAAGLGVSAFVVMGALTACGESESPSPSTTTPTSSSAPSVSPTEKSINPTGGNLFTPPVKAPAAPTAIPGTHN